MHILSPCLFLSAGAGVAEVLAFSSIIPPPVFRQQPIGRINTLDRKKGDNVDDAKMYSEPRFVTHTDDKFIRKLKDLYSEVLPEGAVVLDLMSSHVSHLPDDVPPGIARLDVHGMNREELEANPSRQATGGAVFVRDLNADPSLVGLCATGGYDAVLCCVGVQYLQEAEAVFAEVRRVLRPGGVAVVSFADRFFYQKALVGWIERGMGARARLVVDYFRAAGGFDNDIRVVGDGTNVMSQLMSVGGLGGDPFVAIVATATATKTENRK